MSLPHISTLKVRIYNLPDAPFEFRGGSRTKYLYSYYPNARKWGMHMVTLLENNRGDKRYNETYLELLELIEQWEAI